MSLSNDLTCQELVTEYVEGALPPGKRVRFEQHLAVCPGCATYMKQMRQTIRAAGRLTEESLESDTREQLLRNWKRAG